MEEVKGLLRQIVAELKTLNAHAAQSQANAEAAMRANRDQVSHALSALGGLVPPNMRDMVDKMTKGGV